MDTVQTIPPRRESERCKAITELIESVAKQQEALADILDAEHHKVEKLCDPCCIAANDLICVNRSLERVLAAVTRLELALQLKLDLFHGCLCPEEDCSSCRK